MDKQGLSERKLLAPIKDGLKATQTATFNGVVNPSKEPDHYVRLKASEQAWKLRGKLLNQNNNNFQGPTQIVTVHNYRPQPQESNDNPAN